MPLSARVPTPWRRLAAATALVLIAAPTPAQIQIDGPVTASSEAAELVVWNRPIVTLRAKIGETDPADRVARAADRIESIPDKDLGRPVHALTARVGNLEGLLVFVGSHQVFAILPQDLDPEGNDTIEAVGRTAELRLREVLAARAAQRSLPLLLRGLGLSAVATLLFAAFAWMLARLRRWLEPRLGAAAERRGGAAVRQVRTYVDEILRRAAQLAAWAVALAAAYLWLTYVLSQFPYTEPWGRTLGAGLRNVVGNVALSVAQSMPDLLTVFIIFVIARMGVRVLHSLFDGVEEGRVVLPGIQRETAEATRRISTVLVWLFAVTVAYPYIPGSETDAFRGVSVFVGLMLSLGSAGLVNQVMSGLVVVYARAVRPGEYVQVGKIEGLVSEVGLLSTKLVTPRKEEITIPNTVMIGEATTNYSRLVDKDGAIIATSVTIGYDAPWRQVEALLRLAAERTEEVRSVPPPRVVQRALADFYVEYMLLVSVDEPAHRPGILSALHANIQDAFNEFGVQIMSPHFESQPEGAVVVPRDKWRVPPAE